MMLNDTFYLTDGGLETTLVFHEGIDLPHFAAFEILQHPAGRATFLRYYSPYIEVARKHGLQLLLESPTWRANTDWGQKLGYSQDELDEINRQAILLMQSLKRAHARDFRHVLISGNVGPRGDGYRAEKRMDVEEAKVYHLPQVKAFASVNADLVTALTINYSEEAAGIILAAREAGMRVVISFTVETDGALPSGQSLREAIETTDEITGSYASHFMINCAHPHHFRHVFKGGGNWKDRIKGIRANASLKSHAELDESEVLDTGDKELLAAGYQELKTLLPELRVIGGCCGTDHSHMEEICEVLFAEQMNLNA